MLPWKLHKRHILPASQNLLSVYFSLAKFQLVSCDLSLAMIWQRTYTLELPKLCSATLNSSTIDDLGEWCAVKEGGATRQAESSALGIHDNLVSGNHQG